VAAQHSIARAVTRRTQLPTTFSPSQLVLRVALARLFVKRASGKTTRKCSVQHVIPNRQRAKHALLQAVPAAVHLAYLLLD
jgi:hypothetical protein